MTMKNEAETKIKFQVYILLIGMVLFALKIFTYYKTYSIAILSDALESIVNIVAGIITLSSLAYAARPRDKNHPYGHGKIELLTASIEGVMIIVAGVFIIYHSVLRIGKPYPLINLEIGMVVILITAIINYAMGFWCIKRGKKSNSMALVAEGHHLQSDTYSTLAMIGGLIIYYFTNWYWIDILIASLMGLFIIYTGLKVVGVAVSRLLDSADNNSLEDIAHLLSRSKKNQWIGIHKLTYLKFGTISHIDFHLTLPYYFDLNDTANEVIQLKKLLQNHIANEDLDISIQCEPCTYDLCYLCKMDCPKRKTIFSHNLEWNADIITSNKLKFHA